MNELSREQRREVTTAYVNEFDDWRFMDRTPEELRRLVYDATAHPAPRADYVVALAAAVAERNARELSIADILEVPVGEHALQTPEQFLDRARRHREANERLAAGIKEAAK